MNSVNPDENLLDMGEQVAISITSSVLPATESTSLIRRRPQPIVSPANQPPSSPKKSTLESERVYGRSIFRESAYPSAQRLAGFIACLDAANASIPFATPSVSLIRSGVQWLSEHLPIISNIFKLGASDLWSVLAAFSATPGFLLLLNGSREMTEEILKRVSSFRPYDLASLGITHRFFDSAYNHDNKWMYGIEALVFLPSTIFIIASPTSVLKLATDIVNNEDYILNRIMLDTWFRTFTANILGYLAILKINATYFSGFIDGRLNQLAAKLGDSSDIAVKRKELLRYLNRLKATDFSRLNREGFFAALNEYSKLTLGATDEVAIARRQLQQIMEIPQRLEIVISDRQRRGIKDLLIILISMILLTLSIVPTLNMAYKFIDVPWLPFTKDLSDGEKCLAGLLSGSNAALISTPLNFIAIYEMLNLIKNINFAKMLSGIRNINLSSNDLKQVDYNQVRNLTLTLIFSLFSAFVAFMLAWQNPLDTKNECLTVLTAHKPAINIPITKLFELLNIIIPFTNFTVSLALALKPLTEFLGNISLKSYIRDLRYASDIKGLLNSAQADASEQKWLFKAAIFMYKSEVDRFAALVSRAPGSIIQQLPAAPVSQSRNSMFASARNIGVASDYQSSSEEQPLLANSMQLSSS